MRIIGQSRDWSLFSTSIMYRYERGSGRTFGIQDVRSEAWGICSKNYAGKGEWRRHEPETRSFSPFPRSISWQSTYDTTRSHCYELPSILGRRSHERLRQSYLDLYHRKRKRIHRKPRYSNNRRSERYCIRKKTRQTGHFSTSSLPSIIAFASSCTWFTIEKRAEFKLFESFVAAGETLLLMKESSPCKYSRLKSVLVV